MSSSMKPETADQKTESKLTCDFDILRQSPIFAGADIAVVKLFAYLAQKKKYKAGEQIILHGREAAEAFYLIAGNALVSSEHNKKEVTLQKLGPGTFFGELALLARFKWFFNVYAKEDCEVMIISRESFKKVLDNFPERRDKMIEKIVQLRVARLIDQTDFLLAKVPDTLLKEGGTAI